MLLNITLKGHDTRLGGMPPLGWLESGHEAGLNDQHEARTGKHAGHHRDRSSFHESLHQFSPGDIPARTHSTHAGERLPPWVGQWLGSHLADRNRLESGLGEVVLKTEQARHQLIHCRVG